MNLNANTVTVIVAIAAIVSPILVAFINNHHQIRMAKLDYEHQEYLKKLELEDRKNSENTQFLYSIYENYLQSASRCIANPTHDNIKLYGEHYSISFIYFPSKFYKQLKSTNAFIRDRDWGKANESLEDLSIKLSKEIKDIMK